MENRLVDMSELPPWQQEQKPNMVCTKLIADLSPKVNYMCHYRTLQFAMELGFVVTKVHAVLAFDQAPIFKPFVDQMAESRKKATSDAERDKYKLCVTSVAGKMLENVRTRTECNITFTDDEIEKSRRWRHVDSQVHFGNECIGLFMTPRQFKIRQSIMIGVAIYELSKLIMLNHFYTALQPQFGVDNVKLMYMDTDSFILNIRV